MINALKMMADIIMFLIGIYFQGSIYLGVK